MCGIVACRTGSPAADFLLRALRRLEYRGYDSVGVAVWTVDGGIARLRTTDRVCSLERAVASWSGPALGNVGIGHSRWATHGSACVANAHPHTDCSGRIHLVHNGIIENADDLRGELKRRGHRLSSSVDSEVICHLIEEKLCERSGLVAAVRDSLPALRGSWALAVLEEGSGRVVVAAHRCPLLIARSPAGLFATSDIAAVAEWVEDYHVLMDGDVVELTDSYFACERSAPPAVASGGSADYDIELYGYTDYMAKEIDEQPAAAARVIDELAGRVANGELWREQGLASFERLQIVGCGTSLNAGHVIGNLVRRLGRVPTRLTVASEATDEVSEPHMLRLAISQSGETADVLHAVRHGVEAIPLLALTNNPHSTLARQADAVIMCSAGPEIGVAATKTFVCQVIAGAAIMLSALVATNRLTSREAGEFVEQIRALPDRLAAASAAAKCVVPPLAEELSSAAGFLFIGRGLAVPYAAEGALKLKELSYRWAQHYPAGELKHGPLALVGEGTPVVAVLSGDSKIFGNIAEVEARGGRVICVGPAPSTIAVPVDPGAPWGPLEGVIALQIFARTVGLSLGWDVDKPRNLAKSVTVE